MEKNIAAAGAFALFPRAMVVLSLVNLGVAFCAGGSWFCLLQVYPGRRGGTRAQFMARLVDKTVAGHPSTLGRFATTWS